MSEVVLRLVTRGDWACAFGEGAVLADICRELNDVVGPGLAEPLAELTMVGQIDETTRRRWVELASSLRGRAAQRHQAAPGGRHS